MIFFRRYGGSLSSPFRSEFFFSRAAFGSALWRALVPALGTPASPWRAFSLGEKKHRQTTIIEKAVVVADDDGILLLFSRLLFVVETSLFKKSVAGLAFVAALHCSAKKKKKERSQRAKVVVLSLRSRSPPPPLFSFGGSTISLSIASARACPCRVGPCSLDERRRLEDRELSNSTSWTERPASEVEGRRAFVGGKRKLIEKKAREKQQHQRRRRRRRRRGRDLDLPRRKKTKKTHRFLLSIPKTHTHTHTPAHTRQKTRLYLSQIAHF